MKKELKTKYLKIKYNSLTDTISSWFHYNPLQFSAFFKFSCIIAKKRKDNFIKGKRLLVVF